eukprot:1051395-Rhodomonas_salina.1
MCASPATACSQRPATRARAPPSCCCSAATRSAAESGAIFWIHVNSCISALCSLRKPLEQKSRSQLLQ